jgi:hypothetical protein
MSVFLEEHSSFRDNFGKVFYFNNEVYRLVNSDGLHEYNFLKDKNIYEFAINSGFLVNFTEEDLNNDINIKKELKQNQKILKADKIDYISYSHEWCFSQLRDAALFHLDFQINLLEKDIILRDSSSHNIQFKNSKPIFIDILSLSSYKIGEPWLGYRQFCEFFLNPLLIYKKKNIYFNSYLRGSIDGIKVEETNKILSLLDKFNPKVFIHVFLHNYLISKYQKKTFLKFSLKENKISKKTYLSILLQLRNWINNMKNTYHNTTWSNYMNENIYDKDEFIIKNLLIEEFVRKKTPKKLIDFGCNNGHYSELALKNGAKFVLGLDFDHDCIAQAYDLAKNKQLNFLPLVYDATNPSSNSGWRERERKGFLERNKCHNTSILMLAFIHHLVIAKNIPLKQVIDYFTSISDNGIIEFVPKNDPTVQKMLLGRDDIFEDYNLENFEKILSANSRIVNKTKVTNYGRILYEYESL